MSLRRTHHPDVELLSAYLDDEVALVEARALESHLQTCIACRGKLKGLRGVVHQLSGLERPAPPPWLLTQVRREVIDKKPESVWRRLGGAFLQLPFATPLASAFSVVFSAGSLLLLFSLIGGNLGQGGLSRFTTYPGPVEEPKADPNFVLTETTIDVAGRTFVRQEDRDVWNYFVYETAGQTEPNGGERTVWVEQGLTPKGTPKAIDARSPEGRALLARYADLGYLLADGSRVVMRYRRGETLELRSGA